MATWAWWFLGAATGRAEITQRHSRPSSAAALRGWASPAARPVGSAGDDEVVKRSVVAMFVVAVAAAGCVATPLAVTPPSSSPTTSNAPVTQPATTAPGPWRCPSWSMVSAHPMTNRRIIQPSGLAASRRRSGIWWTHNDTCPPSPKVTSLYALEESTGDVIATLNVTGVGLGDWEDLDAVTVGGVDYLWIADPGDNLKNRTTVELYRVAEPTLTAPARR